MIYTKTVCRPIAYELLVMWDFDARTPERMFERLVYTDFVHFFRAQNRNVRRGKSWISGDNDEL